MGVSVCGLMCPTGKAITPGQLLLIIIYLRIYWVTVNKGTVQF